MTLVGKGFFIWQIQRCEGGIPGAIAARAKSAGLSHVLIKIADGSEWAYNYDQERNVDLVPPVASALREEGIQVWGWHYIWGKNPIGEARLAIRRIRELDVDGYVIDAEKEFKEKGMRSAAKRFMRELRSALPRLPVALSTYRYPRLHKEVPYAEFLEGCDYAMPQVYFEKAHNPEQQLERTLDQYMDLRPARPVIPTAPTYATSDWEPTKDELRRFFRRAKDLGLTAANAWSWDFASRPQFRDLWDAVAEFDWPAKPPVADVPERLIRRLNKGDAASISKLYVDNAAHVTGARTVLGRPAIRDWYQTVLTEILPNANFTLTGKSGTGDSRHFTWTASSDRGSVLDGNDTLGLRDGSIQYHYTYFTVA